MGEAARAEIVRSGPMTLEAWADMGEDEPGELVDGRLVEEEVPDNLHEAVVAWMLTVLCTWASKWRAPVLGSEHKIAVSKRSGRKPDVTMYAPGTRLGRGSISRIPPMLVVEVLSPRRRDVVRDRHEKHSEYAQLGVRSYLLVDPEARLVELYELGADGRYIRAASAERGKLAVAGCEGLELDLDAMWSQVAWVIGDDSFAEPIEDDPESTDE